MTLEDKLWQLTVDDIKYYLKLAGIRVKGIKRDNINQLLTFLEDKSWVKKVFDELPDYDIELYRNKKMKTDPEIARNSLIEARGFLESIDSYDHDTIYTGLVDLAQKMGVKNGVLMYPIRVALSGKAFTPGGAIELSCILGKDETLRRIDIALKKLS